MKIKEMFKKVDVYNELAELIVTDKAVVWFAEELGPVTDGHSFSDYETFRKHVRREYIKDVADFILNDDGWEMNSNRKYINAHGRTMEFVICIDDA